MKILHVIPSYYPATYWGGPIFTQFELNNALAKYPDIEIKVLTTDAAGPKVSEHLNVNRAKNFFPNYSVVFTKRIMGKDIAPDLLVKLPSLVSWADVVHLSATYSFPTIPTLLVCRLMKKPILWSLHGAVLDAYVWKGASRRRIKRVWERVCNFLIMPGGVTVVATSDNEKDISKHRLPQAKATLIRHGVTLPSKLPKLSRKKRNSIGLLYLGRLDPKKGIENLISALALLKEYPEYVLRIFGTGEKKYVASLKKFAQKLNLNNRRVMFLGHVDNEHKSRAFLTSDLCIVPSYTESFAMVVVEALSHGLPVIASMGTPWKKLEKKNCGLWVENDPKSLAGAILDMSKKDLKLMGKNGRQWMKDEFSWEAIAREMYKLYTDIHISSD